MATKKTSKKAPKATKAKANATPKAKADKPAKKAKAPKEAKEKKLSAIDAAAQVLSASKEPMNAKELIEAMAAKGLWTSPGGKTPHATLPAPDVRDLGDNFYNGLYGFSDVATLGGGPLFRYFLGYDAGIAYTDPSYCVGATISVLMVGGFSFVLPHGFGAPIFPVVTG